MAVGGDPSASLHDEATCSICLDYFREPMMIVECGHNFCRACIAEYQEDASGRAAGCHQCPQCRGSFSPHQLRPNRHLGNMVDMIRQLSQQRLGQQETGAKGGGVGGGAKGAKARPEVYPKVCEKHKEAVKLFCQEDLAFLCLICRESRAHKAHTALPIDEAAQEYKDQLQCFLTTLTKDREEILKEKLSNQNEVQQMKRSVGILKQSIASTIPEERDKTRLALLDTCNENMKAIDGLAYDFSELSLVLTKLISEIEDRLQQSAFECLQNIGDLLSRCKREASGKTKADLKRSAQSVADKIASVSTKLNEYAERSCCQSGYLPSPRVQQFTQPPAYHFHQGGRGAAAHSPARPQKQQRGRQKRWIKENILFDPDTAHPRYVVSDDQKTLKWGKVRQFFMDSHRLRFENARCVLGTEGFSSGKHYWTVDVGEGDYWAVGVALESVDRDEELCFEPDEGIWAIARYCDQYKALTSPPTVLDVDDEPTEIQVSLNCDAGSVTFFDAEDRTQLYKFEGIDFDEEVVYPFFRITESSTAMYL